MNFEEALKFLDNAVFEQESRHLSAPEVTILEGTWQGMTYEQMAEASQYSLNYLMRDIGPRFWRLLSEVMEVEVSKSNIRVVLERRSFFSTTSAKAEETVQESQWVIPNREWDENAAIESHWNEAPELSAFFGRTEELATLKQWIEADCHLIAVRGINGIGKTVLARQLIEETQENFDCIIWRSLTQAPKLKDLLTDLLKAFPPTLVKAEGDILLQLMTCLRSLRCLLIFDGVETILQPGQLAGRYQEGYENYGELFRRIGEESHQSCLIITSLENPRDISLLEGETTPVRSLTLSGLPILQASEILQTEGLVDRSSWQTLIERYQGNPAALKMAAKAIADLFNGNVAEFLERKTFIFGEIGELLAPVMQRLSDLEKEVLYWLAIERRAISFTTLKTSLSLSISDGELLEILASLGGRSLLETTTSKEGKSLFSLPPTIVEYVTSQLIEQISDSGSDRQKLMSRQWQEDTIELTPAPKQPVNLSQWLHHTFEVAWQPIEALLANSQLSPRLRSIYHLRGESTIKRFKLVQLPKSAQAVALLIAIAQENDFKVSIRAQVQPTGEETLLPSNLKLALLNESGQILREVKAQSEDNFIQLPRFRGEPKECFSLQISHNAFSVKEDFVI